MKIRVQSEFQVQAAIYDMEAFLRGRPADPSRAGPFSGDD
jgi:hypothetical protein